MSRYDRWKTAGPPVGDADERMDRATRAVTDAQRRLEQLCAQAAADPQGVWRHRAALGTVHEEGELDPPDRIARAAAGRSSDSEEQCARGRLQVLLECMLPGDHYERLRAAWRELVEAEEHVEAIMDRRDHDE